MNAIREAEIEPALLAGRLEGVDLPDLLWSICRVQRTGLLELYRHPVRRVLYIQEGRIVFASSSDPNDRLGEMLLRKGAVTLEDLEAALLQLRTGKRLGTLLVEAGSLTSEELVDAVLGQVRSIVLDLLEWEQAEYSFREGELPTREVITLQGEAGDLLLQGIRNIHSFTRIRRGVGPSRTVYALRDSWKETLAGLNPTEGEKLLLTRLEQGKESVETLCSEVCVSNFEIYRAVWAFKVLGVIEEQDWRLEERAASTSAGRLEDMPFPDLLIHAGTAGETGVLYVSRAGVDRSFHVQAGRCVFATSSNPDDGLVSFLLRRGVISLRDRDETEKRMLSNKRVGTILRELGVLDDEDLRETVREQLSEIVYDTFRWEEGEYTFAPGPLPSFEEITLDRDVATLIAEGVRRVRSWTRVIVGCGGVDNPLGLTPSYLDLLDRMGAGVDEWEVVNTLKTPQTPRRVCPLTDIDDFRACQILWTLRLLGAVERVEPVVDEEEIGAEDADWIARKEAVEAALRELPEQAATGDAAFDSADAVADEARPPSCEAPASQELSGLAGGSDDAELGATPVSLEEPELIEGVLAEPEPLPAEPQVDESTQQTVEEEEPLPEGDLPGNVDQVIRRFNAMHRVVYRAVRAEIGAGAVNFVRSCGAQVGQSGADPVEDVELSSDGSWSAHGLKRVILTKGIEDPWPAYQRVLDREYLLLKPHLGDAKAVALKQQIWELQQGESPRPEHP